MLTKEQKRLRHLFEDAKKMNLPEGSIHFSDGRIFYGRIVKEDGKQKVIVGIKNKHYHIYSQTL